MMKHDERAVAEAVVKFLLESDDFESEDGNVHAEAVLASRSVASVFRAHVERPGDEPGEVLEERYLVEVVVRKLG